MTKDNFRNIKFVELILRVFLILIFVVVCVHSEIRTVEDIVVRWAPLIWLAPGEKYFPISVKEFLQHVYPASEPGIPERELRTGRSSEKLYLITRKDLAQLINGTSFLNGRNPSKESVPIYVTVTECPVNSAIPYWADKYSSNIRNDIYNYNENNPKLYFHVTYWTFYPYNEGKEVCFIGKVPTPFLINRCLGTKKTMGNHIGDWEHVSLFFMGKRHPEEMYVSTHDAGVYYKYDRNSRVFKYNRQVTRKGIVQRPKFPSILRTSGDRPVLFSALGSHGLWSAPGEHSYTRVGHFTDKTGHGDPWKTWQNINIHYMGKERPPIWANFLGKWGNPKSNCFLSKKLGICEFFDGPQGVLRKQQNFQCGTNGEYYTGQKDSSYKSGFFK